MNTKAKGTNAERELIHLFWANGWAACRTPGSGSIKYPSPDIIAGNNFRKIVIECKNISFDSHYFPEKEIQQLQEFARLFNAEPWVGIKFGKRGWFFSSIEGLRKTGKHFQFSIKTARSKGFLFNELIGRFSYK